MPKLFCFICITLFMACQDKKESRSAQEKTQDTTVVTEKDAISPVPGAAESLAKMAPLTEQEMRDLLPAQLMGAAKQNDEVDGAIGTMIATADYPLNDSTTLKLSLIDCGGPAGVGVYNMQYLGMLGVHEENDNEYTRTVNFGDGKAFESCSKKETDCSLTWFVGRYLVSLSGNIAASKLKEVAGSIRL
jgi:hypothetical protein